METTAACLADGLAAVADDLASTAGVGPIEPLGPGWCLIVRAEVERPFYAGRLIEHAGAWQFMSWAQFDGDGAFVGALADPVPVTQHGDGTLALAALPSLATLPEGRRTPRARKEP